MCHCFYLLEQKIKLWNTYLYSNQPLIKGKNKVLRPCSLRSLMCEVAGMNRISECVLIFQIGTLDSVINVPPLISVPLGKFWKINKIVPPLSTKRTLSNKIVPPGKNS